MYESRQNSYNRQPSNLQRGQSRPTLQQVKAESLPEDYVRQAEAAIQKLKEIADTQGRNGTVISTSKLRSLFSLFTEPYNEVSRRDIEKLDRDQINALNGAKVRIYYEIGREDGYRGDLDSASVGRFVKYSKLLEYLYDIGNSCDKMIQFYHYMEALVAFHRYYFGEKRDIR